MKYLSAYSRTQVRVARLAVLNASLLTSAVSNFEVLVSNVVKAFINLHPQALKSDDMKYSLAEISAFESLDEFQDFASDRYVEGVLRGSFDDWMLWFGKQLKVKVEVVAPNPAMLREVFQRRHLFVHNGGRVNRLYLSKLPELADPPAIETQLAVDSTYLASAIDTLTSAGTVLTTMVLRQLVPAEDFNHVADSMATDAVYEFLRRERWGVVDSVSAAISDGCTSDYTRYVLRVNGWIARKRERGVSAIRSEVEAWPVSALHPRFRLARLALLDEVAEAHQLAIILVEQGELSQDDWRNWPLLAEVRTYAAQQNRGAAESSLDSSAEDGQTKEA